MTPNLFRTPWGDSSVNISIPKQTIWRHELEQYLQLNDDLPRSQVLQMAPFALWYAIGGRQGIEKMFSGIQSTTPRYHYPYFIWWCLSQSGMDEFWFGDELNREEIDWKTWMGRIVRNATDDQKHTFLRRMYREKLPYPRRMRQERLYLWTKGGTWFKRDGMSRILVLGEHLERPENWWSKALGPEVRRIEREVRRVADPDQMTYPQAYYTAIDYVRDRVKGPATRRMGYGGCTWFFQMPLRTPEGKWWNKDGKQNRQDSRRPPDW